jgi:hypothetical protein
LLRTGEPLYCSCHVRLKVKHPVKAAQLESLTDWGLQGPQRNISTVTLGKLVVVDQRARPELFIKPTLPRSITNFLDPSVKRWSSSSPNWALSPHPSLPRLLLL